MGGSPKFPFDVGEDGFQGVVAFEADVVGPVFDAAEEVGEGGRACRERCRAPFSRITPRNEGIGA